MFLGPNPASASAGGAGSRPGSCWVATSFGINYLFDARAAEPVLINGGYHTLQFTLIGADPGAVGLT